MFKGLPAIAIAFLLLPSLYASPVENQPRSEKLLQINAERIVLNVNGGVAEQLQGADRKDKTQTATGITHAEALFKGDLMSAIDALSTWDGFRPWKIVYLACGFIAALALSRFIRWLLEIYLVKTVASKTQSKFDDLVFNAIGRPCSLLTFIIFMYISFLPMMNAMPLNIEWLCDRLFLAFGAIAIAWAAYRLAELLDHVLTRIASNTDNQLDDLIIGIIRKITRVCIIIVSILFIGQNILGLNITTLLAGAGVAGLAIAFAAQDSIANFFGSLMIILDRPFSVGDYVKVDSYEGTIERVGLRSSALRTLGGHLITIPNKLAANCSIENITRRPFIRNVTNLGLVYNTRPEKVEEALTILKEIFANHEGSNEKFPPKINFTDFKDCSLGLEIITWYHPGDYFKHREWMTKINLEILRRFNAAKIEFAFPTNTTYLANTERLKLEILQDSNSGK